MAEKICMVFCRCGGQVISKEKEEQIASGLKQFEADIFELNDLCAFTINKREFLDSV